MTLSSGRIHLFDLAAQSDSSFFQMAPVIWELIVYGLCTAKDDKSLYFTNMKNRIAKSLKWKENENHQVLSREVKIVAGIEGVKGNCDGTASKFG